MLSVIRTYGIIAYPNKICVLTDDNTNVYIYLKGDENCKWGISEDGYTILPTEKGWVYAQADANGFAIPSTYRLSSENCKCEELKSFLLQQPKSIKVNHSQRNINRTTRIPDTSTFKSSPIVGNRKALVILMSFADLDFKKKREDFDNLFNKINYNEDGARGSVKDFFLWSSYGKLDFTCDVIGPFKAAHNMAYYGGNSGETGQDKNPFSLFEEAVQLAARQINLKDYDSDGDGFVDNIHIIFAGYGEEAGAMSSAIWSHEMTFNPIKIQGININKYSCAPELRNNSGNGISRIGPHCHEMGHALGAMDYYDVDYETNGNFPGTGNWDIMASGSWNEEGICPPDFNPYVKVFNFGWAEAKDVDSENIATIYPSWEDENQIYRLNTPVSNEFFLLENRQKQGFDSAIPGEGLLIFHIGSRIENNAQNNKINSCYPQQCYIVCASSEFQVPSPSPSSYGNLNSPGCPFPGTSGKTSFSDSTVPSALCVDGTPSGINISNINESFDGIITLGTENVLPDKKLWQETFEDSSWSDRWTQESQVWKLFDVNDDSKNYLGNMPSIVQGNCYLYMKLGSISIGGSNNDGGEVVSSPLTLNENCDVKLHFKYYNSPDLVNTTSYSNLLTVFIESNGERVKLASFSNTEKEWNSANISLDIEKGADFRIIFQGEGHHSGYICIDDIQISGKSESSIKPVFLLPGKTEDLYSINGIKQTSTVKKLPQGFYILCGKNGERKKIFMK